MSTYLSYGLATQGGPHASLGLPLLPPKDPFQEAQDAAKLAKEARAKAISDEIDQMLLAEKQQLQASNPIRLLLLGQSESGKSTTLKNFQILYAPKAFRAERAAWRLVILLNFVRSVRLIVDTLSDELDLTDSVSPNPPLSPTSSRTYSNASKASASPRINTSRSQSFSKQYSSPPLCIDSSSSDNSYAIQAAAIGIGPIETLSEAALYTSSSSSPNASSNAIGSGSGHSPSSANSNVNGATKRTVIGTNNDLNDKKRSKAYRRNNAINTAINTALRFAGSTDKTNNRSTDDDLSNATYVHFKLTGHRDHGNIEGSDLDLISRRADYALSARRPSSTPFIKKNSSDNGVTSIVVGGGEDGHHNHNDAMGPRLPPGLPVPNLPQSHNHNGIPNGSPTSPNSSSCSNGGGNFRVKRKPVPLESVSTGSRSPTTPYSNGNMSSPTTPSRIPSTPTHRLRLLMLRLSPLITLEDQLKKKVRAARLSIKRNGSSNQPSDFFSLVARKSTNSRSSGGDDFSDKSSGRETRVGSVDDLDVIHEDREGEEDAEEEDVDFGSIIQACAEDVTRLWKDSIVREILFKRGVRLEDRPGFFLNSVDRISQPNYSPSTDDILRARLQTSGISEHRFKIEHPSSHTHSGSRFTVSSHREWIIYDVGGMRTQRAAWQPFFDFCTAIIFLAPLSGFDMVLEEDPSVNRMNDSLELFRSVCSSKILAKVSIILFLNKVDLLDAKLRAGIRVKDYIPTFGDRNNDVETVSRFFRMRFSALYKEASPSESNRIFYTHMTSVTNPRAMEGILHSIRDVVSRANMDAKPL